MQMKTRTVQILTTIVWMTLALSAWSTLVAQTPSKTLKVRISYLGEGEVDSTHGIHVWLFNTPNIAEGATPVSMNSSYENGAVMTFSSLSESPLYLVVAYGDFSLMGPPPSGTPVAMYKPGDVSPPTAIELTEDVVEIEFTFDDSYRMP